MLLLRSLRRLARLITHCGYRRRFEFNRPKCGAGLYKFGDDDHWSLHLFGTYIYLWAASTPPVDDMLDSWSFDFKPFGERNLYLCWGDRSKFIHMPWSFDWISTAKMDTGGKFQVVQYSNRGKHAEIVLNDPLEEQTYPFEYTTKRGEYQPTTATVKAVERRVWQWKLFRFLRLPLMRKTRYSLDVWFADEMGSERGSWKGGTIGTGCDWRPGQTIDQAMRAFELKAGREYTFCR